MSTSLVAITSGVIGLLGIAARLFFWLQGRKNEQAKVDKSDADVLQKQRDNDVTSVSGADDFWVRIRRRKDK